MSFVDARRGYVVISNNTDTHSPTHTHSHTGRQAGTPRGTRACVYTHRTHAHTQSNTWPFVGCCCCCCLVLVAVGNVSWSSNKFGKQTRFGLCFIVVAGCGCCCCCSACAIVLLLSLVYLMYVNDNRRRVFVVSPSFCLPHSDSDADSLIP